MQTIKINKGKYRKYDAMPTIGGCKLPDMSLD